MQRYPYKSGDYVDDFGRRWRRVQDWLEPDEVRSFLRRGVETRVQWCGIPPRPGPIEGDELERILPNLLERRVADKKMRKRRVPVVVAELWRSGTDHLVMFVEGDPQPRDDSWFHSTITG